jgi:uncharacterized protein YuzE
MDLLIDRDEGTGAEYVRLAEGNVMRTMDLGDVLVDVGSDDLILGVEFVAGIEATTHDEWLSLFNVAPQLKDYFPNRV